MVVHMSCISQSVFLLHFAQFCAGRHIHHPFMDHGKTFLLIFGKLLMQSNSAVRHDDGGDEVEVYALCCQEHTTTVCAECNENYWPTHLWGHQCLLGICTAYLGHSQIWSDVVCSVGKDLGLSLLGKLL